MIHKRKLFQSRETLINTIILSIGIILVLFGTLIYNAMVVSTTVISIGASLIASSVVSYISTYAMMVRALQNEVTEKWGIQSIAENRGIMNAKVDEYLNKTIREMDIIAYGLKSFRESKEQVIIHQLQSGMHLRIITVNPDSSLLTIKDDDENKNKGSTEGSIVDLVLWMDNLKDKYRNNVELKLIDRLPTELYFRMDNMIFVGPYELLRESQQTITFQFMTNTDGGNYYQNYFNQLWNIAIEWAPDQGREGRLGRQNSSRTNRTTHKKRRKPNK